MGPPLGHYSKVTFGDETVSIFGYQQSNLRSLIFYLLCFLSCGFLRLVCYWKEELHIRLIAVPSSLDLADFVLIIDEHLTKYKRRVRFLRSPLSIPREDGTTQKADYMRYFSFHKLRFVWDSNKQAFFQPAEFTSKIPLGHLVDEAESDSNGLSKEEVSRRTNTLGRNLIEVKLRSIAELFIREAISPFYIFQLFSVALWYCDEYTYYASLIIIIAIGSISMEIYEIRKQERKLRAMVHSVDAVEVIRNGGKIERVSSADVVVGDILVVPRTGCILHCDAALLNGTVIVSESMLTGESVPVTKVAVTASERQRDSLFDMDEHSKHVLFCGTKILQTRYYSGEPVKAVVLRTAFSTLKGQLVRSIMYPKPVDFRFARDLFKFILFLSGIAAVGFVFTIAMMSYRGSELTVIIIRALDIITIVVPPALPAAMTVGVISANRRLRKMDIFCTSPSTINTCGAVNVVCFDKTGTLTEDGLNFNAARAIIPRATTKIPLFTAEAKSLDTVNHGELIRAMACCHSLTKVDGEIIGDPLDLILFEETKWTLTEGGEKDDAVAEEDNFDTMQPMLLRPPHIHPQFGGCSVVRQFPFSSSLQRMSVIVQAQQTESAHDMTLYAKGSPEMIRSLCKIDTIPMNYDDVVSEYAQHGYRIIAVAKSTLDITFAKAHRIAREEVEEGLELLGLIVLENRMKAETNGVIAQLSRANIRSIMVTGDNLLTAMSVARECGILNANKKIYVLEHHEKEEGSRTRLSLRLTEGSVTRANGRSEEVTGKLLGRSDKELERHLTSPGATSAAYSVVVSGPTFAVVTHEYPELMDSLVCCGAVYARMAPEQKQALIHSLQEIDYTVVMCGDGANDCAALKAAHAGISLSEEEASIAAPFTSKTPNISCVPAVIAEGRAALVTSFGIFQYMSTYSLTQFITVLFLYTLPSNLTDFQFLEIDLLLVTVNTLFFGGTPACRTLSPEPPPTQLLSVSTVVSVTGVLSIVLISQAITFVFVRQQPWYETFVVEKYEDGSTNDETPSHEASALFLLTGLIYITLIIIYSKGTPYRKNILRNKMLCISLLVTTLIHLYITIIPMQWTVHLFELKLPPFWPRLYILLFSFFICVVLKAFESSFMPHVNRYLRRQRWMRQMKRDPSSASCRYERLLLDIGDRPSWLNEGRGHSNPIRVEEEKEMTQISLA